MLDPTRLALRRQQADDYARNNDLDLWGARVVWYALSEGVDFARRACTKFNRQSPAWRSYCRLLDTGLIVNTSEEQGIVYDAMPCWENGDGPLLWFNAVARVASGGEPPDDLPRRI